MGYVVQGKHPISGSTTHIAESGGGRQYVALFNRKVFATINDAQQALFRVIGDPVHGDRYRWRIEKS